MINWSEWLYWLISYVLYAYVELKASGECYESVIWHLSSVRSSQVDRLWLEAAERDLWQISGLQRPYLVVHKNTFSTVMKVKTTWQLSCYGCVLLYRSLHVTFFNPQNVLLGNVTIDLCFNNAWPSVLKRKEFAHTHTHTKSKAHMANTLRIETSSRKLLSLLRSRSLSSRHT